MESEKTWTLLKGIEFNYSAPLQVVRTGGIEGTSNTYKILFVGFDPEKYQDILYEADF